MAIEGAIIACRIVQAEMKAIKAAIARANLSDHQIVISDDDRFAVFRGVWSIVDRLDVICQILNDDQQSIGFRSSPIQASCLAAARVMRNGMDHSLGTLKKIGVAKKHAPIFGLLLFCYYTPQCIQEIEGKTWLLKRHAAMITLSSMHLPWHGSFAAVFGTEVYLPFGNFVFDAFGETVKLEAAEELSNSLLNYISTTVHQRLITQFGAQWHMEQGPICGLLTEVFDHPVEYLKNSGT